MSFIKKFENYMSREEMCSVLCRCGYNMSELQDCSMSELQDMCRASEVEKEDNHSNNTITQEKKGEKWIKDAIKKPGSLRKSMKKEEGEKISKTEIDSELQALKGKDKDKSKKGVQGLSKKDLTKYRRLNLAKTLKGLKENQETQNYMFFGNLQTIKRLVDEMLEMDESQLDNILKEHNWALDHIATSKDDIEEVFNFLAGHNEPHDDEEYDYRVKEETPESDHQSWMGNESSHEETEGQLANKDLEDEMKNIKSFGNFGK